LLLGFSAVNTGNNLLFLVVSALLAFMAVTGLAGMLNLQKLTPRIQIPAEIFARTPAAFRLQLVNSKKRLPSFLIQIKTSSGDSLNVPIVSSGTSYEGDFSISFPERGPATVGVITVSSTFPVGFFTRYWKFIMEEPLVVFPRLMRCEPYGSGSGREEQGAGKRISRGADGELDSIAEYSGVEPLRLIHWKHSARSDDLLVKEFNGNAVKPLLINLKEVPGQHVEEQLSRAAWLVRQYITQRPVGLVLDRRVIPPASGRRQSQQLLKELAMYGKA
jgi:uncharacterized protein (DUF58 family)